MPRSFPDMATMLKAAIAYLEDDLMPSLDGYHKFKVRVTANVLSTIRRELTMREEQAQAELTRLAALVGHDGALEELSRELCELIRTERISTDDPALREYIRHSLSDALSLNNPKWLLR